MKSTYVSGTDRRKDDEEITQSLSDDGIGDGSYPKRIGIRNERGTIYRNIETRGTSELVSVLQSLYGLGFCDELEHASSTVSGYDAIFSK